MYKLGNSSITSQQLLKLGAHIHENNKEYFFYPNSLALYETDLLNLYKKTISIRAENWFECLCEIFENMKSIHELDWLFAAAQFLKFRGDADSQYPIDEAMRLIKEFDLTQYDQHFIISYWLKRISIETYKPQKIYTEQHFIDRLLTNLQLDKIIEIDNVQIGDLNLFKKLENQAQVKSENRYISKKNNV